MPALPTPATCARPGAQAGRVATAVPVPPPPRRAAAQATATATSAAAALATSFLLLASPTPALAADAAPAAATAAAPAEPAALFARNCAGCHAGGGNVVAPGATLLAPDLTAAGLDSPEAVFKLVYGGRGRMPGYGTDCAPKVRGEWRKRERERE